MTLSYEEVRDILAAVRDLKGEDTAERLHKILVAYENQIVVLETVRDFLHGARETLGKPVSWDSEELGRLLDQADRAARTP